MRPGRISAGSSFSGWLLVMTTMRFGQSTTPSSTFSRPARSSLSLAFCDAPVEGPAAGASSPSSLSSFFSPSPFSFPDDSSPSFDSLSPADAGSGTPSSGQHDIPKSEPQNSTAEQVAGVATLP